MSSSTFIPRNIQVSLAKNDTGKSIILLFISDICFRNRRGPHSPCGTPLLTWVSLDVVPLTVINYCPFDRKLCIHTPPLPSIPIFMSLFNSMPWSTLSQAFAKSMLITSFFDFSYSSIILLSWERQDLLDQKPCYLGLISDVSRGIGGYCLEWFFSVFFIKDDVRATWRKFMENGWSLPCIFKYNNYSFKV